MYIYRYNTLMTNSCVKSDKTSAEKFDLISNKGYGNKLP